MASKLPTYGLDQLKSTDEDIKNLFYTYTFFYEGYGYAYSDHDKLTDTDKSFKIFRLNKELQDEFVDKVKHVVRADLIDVLCYKYLKYYSYQKIADEMGIKKSSVGTKLVSARGEISKVIRAFDREYIKTYVDKITYKIISTVPGVKWDRAQAWTKPATIETGMEIQVPLYKEEWDEVVVNTLTGTVN